MKYRIILFGLLAFSIALKAQQFNVSMKPGDVRVYRLPNFEEFMVSVKNVLREVVDVTPINKDDIQDTVLVRFPSAFIPFDTEFYPLLNVNVCQTVSGSGILIETTDQGGRWYEKCPLSPPVLDTMTLSGRNGRIMVQVKRRFDTTVFGMNVPAFTVSLSGNREVTVADQFGILRVKTDQGESRLIRASLAGREYNYPSTTINIMKLCVGDARHYKTREWDWMGNNRGSWISYENIMKDTILNGKRYFVASSGLFYRNDPTGLYVWDASNNKENLKMSAYLTVGDIWGNEMVIDTGTVTWYEKKKKSLTLGRSGFDYVSSRIFLEDIGFYSEDQSNLGFWRRGKILEYLKHCGQTFGTPLLSENPITVAHFSLSHPYPNPISSTLDKVTIAFTLPSSTQVLVEVYDILGRKIRTITDGFFPSGSNRILIPTRDLQPGMYLTFIRTSSGILSQKIIVE